MTSEQDFTQQDQGQVEGQNLKPQPGWLDEAVTLAIFLPALLSFVPWTQDFVSRGFQILTADAPSWYLGALSVAGAAAFGNKTLPGGLAGLIRSPKG